MSRRSLISIFVVPLFLLGTTYGKSIEELIKEMTEDLVEAYSKPLVTGFGTAINSGLYNTASAHKILGFDFGTKLMYVPIPVNDKTAKYSVLTFTVDPNTNDIDTSFTEVESKTIFGDTQMTTLRPPANTFYIPYALPGGVGIPGLPLIVPQLSVGIYKGFELMARYVSINFEETKISLFGMGVKQNFNALPFMSKLPVDIAAQFVYNSFKLGNIITCNNRNFNLHMSKNLFILTPYLGIGYENTKIKLVYDFAYKHPITHESKTERIDISFSGENNFRAVFGLKFKLLIFDVNADYNMGKYPSFSGGVGLSFR